MMIKVSKACVVIASAFVLAFAACKSSPNAVPASTPAPIASPETIDQFTALLFADQSLEEITKSVDTTSSASSSPPWSLFTSALTASRQGKTEQAKNNLKQVLAMRDGESRVQLWAWKALRELGERPPADIADQVQGVVCELHNEAGVGTMAAYADGRARWVGGQGNVIGWEAPGNDAEINGLVGELIRSTEPLVRTAPLSDKHKTPEPPLDHFRVSILTFSGIRVVEVFGPEIDEGHPVANVLATSVKLLDALAKKSEKPK
jgi:hypothetical protein